MFANELPNIFSRKQKNKIKDNITNLKYLQIYFLF